MSPINQPTVTHVATDDSFRRYFELGLIGMAITSPTAGFLDVNDRLCEMLGYERSELLQMTWAQLTHPDDLAVSLAQFNRILAGEIEACTTDKRYIRKDGRVIDTTISAKCLRRSDGTVDSFVALFQDITERRTNETIEMLLDNIPDNFFALSKDWRFTYLNKGAEEQMRILGKDPASLIGKVLWEEFPQVSNEHALRRVMSERIAIIDELYYSPLGQWVENHMYPSLDGGVVTFQRYITDRKRAEEELDRRVVERTRQLTAANEELRKEITERKRAEEALRTNSEQLRALSASLNSAREEEGARIARRLHDELGSALTSLKWGLEGLEKPGSLPLRDKIVGLVGLIETTIESVRRISSELRPRILDNLGLTAAIEWQAQQFEGRTGITCKFDAVAESDGLSEEQASAIFRIVQEALTNVLRHAQATRVNIVMEEEEREIVLEVRDNGRGIREEEKTGSPSLGLIGMRERAHLIGGTIEISGAAGKGTVLRLRVPIPERRAG